MKAQSEGVDCTGSWLAGPPSIVGYIRTQRARVRDRSLTRGISLPILVNPGGIVCVGGKHAVCLEDSHPLPGKVAWSSCTVGSSVATPRGMLGMTARAEPERVSSNPLSEVTIAGYVMDCELVSFFPPPRFAPLVSQGPRRSTLSLKSQRSPDVQRAGNLPTYSC